MKKKKKMLDFVNPYPALDYVKGSKGFFDVNGLCCYPAKELPPLEVSIVTDDEAEDEVVS